MFIYPKIVISNAMFIYPQIILSYAMFIYPQIESIFLFGEMSRWVNLSHPNLTAIHTTRQGWASLTEKVTGWNVKYHC